MVKVNLYNIIIMAQITIKLINKMNNKFSKLT